MEVVWAAQPRGPTGTHEGCPSFAAPRALWLGTMGMGRGTGTQGPAPLAAVLWGGRKRSVEAEEVPEPH